MRFFWFPDPTMIEQSPRWICNLLLLPTISWRQHARATKREERRWRNDFGHWWLPQVAHVRARNMWVTESLNRGKKWKTTSRTLVNYTRDLSDNDDPVEAIINNTNSFSRDELDRWSIGISNSSSRVDANLWWIGKNAVQNANILRRQCGLVQQFVAYLFPVGTRQGSIVQWSDWIRDGNQR